MLREGWRLICFYAHYLPLQIVNAHHDQHEVKEKNVVGLDIHVCIYIRPCPRTFFPLGLRTIISRLKKPSGSTQPVIFRFIFFF